MQYYLQLLGEAEEESSLQIVDDTAVPSHLVSKKRITNVPRVQRQADALALLDKDREEGEMSEAEDEEAGRAAQLKSPLGTYITRRDGVKTLFRDWAIPSHQFQNLNISNRASLPPQGFV